MSNTLTAIRLNCEQVRQLAGTSVVAGLYTAVGTAIEHPARQFLIWNLTDQTLMFSLDGLTDHFPIAAQSFFLSDVTSNASLSKGFFLAQNQTLYVKRLGPLVPTGNVYFSVFYADDGQGV